MTHRVVFVTLLLCSTLGARLALSSRTVVPPASRVKAFPTIIQGWVSNGDVDISDNILSVLRADDYLERSYISNGLLPADLFIAYYRSQSAGESMHSPRNCLPGSGWEPISKSYVGLANAPNGSEIKINRLIIQKDGRKALILYWYEAHGQVIANEYVGKAELVWQAMRYGRRDGAIVRITVPIVNENIDAADKSAMSLARATYSEVPSYLPQ